MASPVLGAGLARLDEDSGRSRCRRTGCRSQLPPGGVAASISAERQQSAPSVPRRAMQFRQKCASCTEVSRLHSCRLRKQAASSREPGGEPARGLGECKRRSARESEVGSRASRERALCEKKSTGSSFRPDLDSPRVPTTRIVYLRRAHRANCSEAVKAQQRRRLDPRANPAPRIPPILSG
jgi:hypothetical protein